MSDKLKSRVSLSSLIFLLSLCLFSVLVWYYYTGLKGPTFLAALLMPLVLVLRILILHNQGYIYKRLPPLANNLIVALYVAVCAYAFFHLVTEYEEIAIWRQGSYTLQDYICGLMVFVVVMELSRIEHPILFGLNLVLIVYTMYGYLSPVDFFWHAGVPFERVVKASTVEFATGVFGLYAQLALTLIGAFMLLAGVANGFDAQSALVKVMRRIAGRSRQTVPQTAVLTSVVVGMVSGSSAANAAVVGNFTIPLMKRYGIPGAFAAAVETAASMGGLIMPPLMAVAGFLMAEYLGVPYWEVAIRGFGIAFVYYCTLSLSVYLLGVRLLADEAVTSPKVALYDQLKALSFFLSAVLLIVLMGVLDIGAMSSALYAAVFILVCLCALLLVFKFLLKDEAAAGESLVRNMGVAIRTHADMTSYLALLMATLGIMIGLFTITGFINRMGGLLIDLGEGNVLALMLMAWIFGWIVGAGLPPTATYIILAVTIVRPMQHVGIDPWIAHFFAFLLAVWGELSPPTSLSAAVASRIAEASFMRTMWVSMKLCLPIITMSFAIFTRSDVVVSPGWPQIVDTLLIAVGCAGLAFAMFGSFVTSQMWNTALGTGLGFASFAVLLHPSQTVALASAAVVLPLTVYGTWRHKKVASPAPAPNPMVA